MKKIISGISFLQSTGNEYLWQSRPMDIPLLDSPSLDISYLLIDFELDAETFENYYHEIEFTLGNFLALDSDFLNTITPHIYAYYQDVIQDLGEDISDYMPLDVSEADILQYIRFESVSICQASLNQQFYVMLNGSCQWDVEHGLSISFKQGDSLAMVAGFGHVNNADAYNDKSMDKYIYHGIFVKSYNDDFAL